MHGRGAAADAAVPAADQPQRPRPSQGSCRPGGRTATPAPRTLTERLQRADPEELQERIDAALDRLERLGKQLGGRVGFELDRSQYPLTLPGEWLADQGSTVRCVRSWRRLSPEGTRDCICPRAGMPAPFVIGAADMLAAAISDLRSGGQPCQKVRARAKHELLAYALLVE